ncbi:TniB family NTP-binding protein [Deinococcus sp. Marseille-Q6407]|uniref:TniB family NTP-binding protein n=1 Tax=Deinococcus sp. Marseille-Q6407 TaxID=2969223 RepID=UPI0021BF73EF|nr:TniB family NTP-binding protein [Deinococcus sp. Marseille-Q6407]
MARSNELTPLQELIRRREQMWYAEESRKILLNDLELLLQTGERKRKRSFAIVAESNGGKTALVRRFMKTHPPVNAGDHQIIPAIFINMTLLARVEDLSRVLLEEIGAPDSASGSHEQRLNRFRKLAEAVQLNIIFLDEFHDCATTTGRGQAFLRIVKGLMNDGFMVVPIGTEELAAVLAQDRQLSSRFHFSRARLRRVQDPAVVLSLVQQLSGPGTPQPTDECIHFILKETRGVMGHLLDLVEDTLQHHGAITIGNLREVRQTMDVLDGLL